METIDDIRREVESRQNGPYAALCNSGGVVPFRWCAALLAELDALRERAETAEASRDDWHRVADARSAEIARLERERDEARVCCHPGELCELCLVDAEGMPMLSRDELVAKLDVLEKVRDAAADVIEAYDLDEQGWRAEAEGHDVYHALVAALDAARGEVGDV
jgi:hypothetical protein